MNSTTDSFVFERLSRDDVRKWTRGERLAAKRVDYGPYLAVIAALEPGEGGLLTVTNGTPRTLVKLRLSAAARRCGMRVAWLRAPAGKLKFRLEAREAVATSG
jgi:hypothetical protein